MKVQEMLPGKRDKRWLLYIPLMTFLIVAVMMAAASMVLQITCGLTDIVIFAFLSVVASAAVCGFGYAGMYIAAGSCLAGLVAGLAFMTYVFTRPIQWAGIVGLVSGVQLTVLFFLVGICGQMLYSLFKRRESYGRK